MSNLPLENARELAARWAKAFERTIREADLPFHPPHITGDAEEAALEWSKGPRSLTAFVRADGIELIEISGPNIVSDMHAVSPESKKSQIEAWKWLRGG